MSITYPDHIVVDRPVPSNAGTGANPVVDSAPYTPVYARSGKARNGRKAVKTWMILAPIGALVLIGGGVAMAMGGETAEPLDAPVAMASMPVATPMEPEAAPLALEAAAPVETAAAITPAPVEKPAAEARSRAPVVRSRVAAAPVVAPVETAPACRSPALCKRDRTGRLGRRAGPADAGPAAGNGDRSADRLNDRGLTPSKAPPVRADGAFVVGRGLRVVPGTRARSHYRRRRRPAALRRRRSRPRPGGPWPRRPR